MQREQDEKLHRVSNELYSATLALRAVVSLIDRGEVDRARTAAAEMLEKIAGSCGTDADTISARDTENTA